MMVFADVIVTGKDANLNYITRVTGTTTGKPLRIFAVINRALFPVPLYQGDLKIRRFTRIFNCCA